MYLDTHTCKHTYHTYIYTQMHRHIHIHTCTHTWSTGTHTPSPLILKAHQAWLQIPFPSFFDQPPPLPMMKICQYRSREQNMSWAVVSKGSTDGVAVWKPVERSLKVTQDL